MDVRYQPHIAPDSAAQKTYIVLPPEEAPKAEPLLSVRFIIFTIVVIAAAIFAASVKSGRVSLDHFFNAPKPGAQAPAAGHSASVAPAATPAPPVTNAVQAVAALVAPSLPPDTFVVSSISIGQPSFAIINGVSRVEGDPVEAPGVTGWKVRQITEDAVLLQNGSTVTPVPLSAPGIQPLDDSLKPLN